MNFLQILAILFTITSIGGYLNKKFFKAPQNVGVLLFSIGFSVLLLLLGKLNIVNGSFFPQILYELDFNNFFLHGVICFLLFAGALQINIQELKDYKYPIFNFATLGVVLSTMITGFSVYWLSNFIADFFTSFKVFKLSLIESLLFGALIAPTDPVSVLSILNKYSVNQGLKVKIAGEALFNDGTSVVLFLTILSFMGLSATSFSIDSVSLIFENLVFKILGGVVVGIGLSWLVNLVLVTIDSYDVEIMITLALAVGSYVLADLFSVSGPIATVVAGLYIGNKSRIHSMSERTREHIDTFWNLVDELLTSILFVIMGLMLSVVDFNGYVLLLGLLATLVVLFGRYMSLILSGVLLLKTGFDIKKTPLMMTWGGLRGGISVALALSLPYMGSRHTLLAITYFVVIFSVIVQGTTFGYLLKYCQTKK
jgi:CPA1 family monovalent cation:H+ antiporter